MEGYEVNLMFIVRQTTVLLGTTIPYFTLSLSFALSLVALRGIFDFWTL